MNPIKARQIVTLLDQRKELSQQLHEVSRDRMIGAPVRVRIGGGIATYTVKLEGDIADTVLTLSVEQLAARLNAVDKELRALGVALEEEPVA